MGTVFLRRPSSGSIDRSLELCDVAFSYEEVGATADLASTLPSSLGSSYDVDEREFELGHGPEVFERASAALFEWRHFEVPWIELHGAGRPAEVGQVVASLVRVMGLWLLNPCRVVWIEPPVESSLHAGFGYGTLPGHAERGEERFVVRLDASTEQVRYEISAFSRPASPLSRLGYPVARRIQARFANATAHALAAAIA